MKRASNLRRGRWYQRGVIAVVSLAGTAAIGLSQDVARGGAGVDEARERSLMGDMPEGFALSRSAHFVLAHDLEGAAAEVWLGVLEGTLDRMERFARSYGLAREPLRQKLEVVCMGRLGLPRRAPQGRRGFGEDPSGYFDPVSGRVYFGLVSAGDGGGSGEAERLTVRHEAAHQVLSVICPRLASAAPQWLAEGLACSFEGEAPADGAEDTLWSPWRAADFVMLLGPDGAGRLRGDAADVVRSPWTALDGGTWTLSARYAASWGIVYHLHQERRAEFGRYLRRLSSQAAALTHGEQIDLFVHEIVSPNDVFGSAVADRVVRATRDGDGG